MNIISLVLAIIAAVIFALAHKSSTPLATVPAGLFFLTLAWMMQLLFAAESITFG